MVDRLAMLEKMAAQRQDDPFPQYGLAMEYRKLKRFDESWAAFEVLFARHPSYVPSYLMAGNVLVELGRPEQAKDVLSRGIEAASAAADDHARSELQAALAELEDPGADADDI